jgi:hypothetical protein
MLMFLKRLYVLQNKETPNPGNVEKCSTFAILTNKICSLSKAILIFVRFQ